MAYFFPHRARAAFLAIALRRDALSFAARAFPPFCPPSRPSATAAGFFRSSVAARTIEAARELRSDMRERLGIREGWHGLASPSRRFA